MPYDVFEIILLLFDISGIQIYPMLKHLNTPEGSKIGLLISTGQHMTLSNRNISPLVSSCCQYAGVCIAYILKRSASRYGSAKILIIGRTKEFNV